MFAIMIYSAFFFSKNKPKNPENEEETVEDKLLCRFVVDGLGKKIGESIAVDKDILIIKSKDQYLGVPLKHIETGDKNLVVKGLVDKEKAEQMGEDWRKESFNKIKHD